MNENLYLIVLVAMVALAIVFVVVIHSAITIDRVKMADALQAAATKVGAAIGNAGRWFVGLFKKS